MATVKLTNVKKYYPGNDTPTVHDFNLDIADKEFIVFVGPSGCGKSTTLRMVAGLEDISEGTVEIDGVIVNDMQPKDRQISMVFQNYALYPHLTVYENIAFPLRLDKKVREVNGKKQKGYTQDEIYERVTNAAQILGITQYLTRKPKALSGGQRQRVAIGRAMVKDCKVFLMDEPLSNLDAKLRNQMRAEIILLRQRIQTTFIYVTHDQTEAMTLGDRIVCLKDGYIMQVGTPTELFDMPANLFVATFIGAPMMNIIKTDLVKEGSKYFVTPFGYKLEVTGAKAKDLANHKIESQPIYLGIRPEHVTLAKKGDKNGIPVRIEVNEMMGSEYHLHVTTIADGTKLVVRIPTINLTEEEREHMVMGEEINVLFESKALHLFNIENERNLLVDEHYEAHDEIHNNNGHITIEGEGKVEAKEEKAPEAKEAEPVEEKKEEKAEAKPVEEKAEAKPVEESK